MTRIATLLLAALSVALVTAQKPSIVSGVFTKEQAQRGRALYQKHCAVCHGGNLLPRDNDASPLTGPDFELAWHGKTVGQRFDQIRTSMPLAAPGSLGDQAYIDILAFIFQYNGYPAGEQELKADLEMLKQIVIEPAPADQTVAPGIPGVVSGGTKVERVLTSDDRLGGEGPIRTPDGGVLFVHQDANRIVRIDRDGTVSTFREETNRTVALAYDLQGRLIGLGGREIPKVEPPRLEVIAPAPAVLVENFEGKPFTMLSDLVIDTKGGIYFTHATDDDPATTSPLEPAVFYRTPTGQVMRVAEGIHKPNAIILSPDEKTLYLANPRGEHVIAFDVDPGGPLRRQRNFAEAPHADGLAVDAAGRLYVASNLGVQVFSREGKALGTIPTPFRPSNLAFAGADLKSLYVVGRGGALRIRMLAEGFRGRPK